MRYLLRVSYQPHVHPLTGAISHAEQRAEYSDGSVEFDTISAAAYRDAMARAHGDPTRHTDPGDRGYRHPERECPDRDPG